MRIQSKIFYADLFSKSPAAAAEIKPHPAAAPETPAVKPMAPLPSALSSKARARDQAPGETAAEAAREAIKQTVRENSTGKALALPVPALPVPIAAVPGNETPVAPAPETPETVSPVRNRRSALMELIDGIDIHDMSPRQMTHLSQTLYAAGALSFEDYSQLAFQPELHPDFERTIGALTGEHAAPDQRRDFVSLWNERADFQRRHNAGRPDLIEQSERIAAVLSRIKTPMNMMA